MQRLAKRLLPILPALLLTLPIPARAQGAMPEEVAALLLLPAAKRPHARETMLLGAARAGRRLVAVGDHGTILLSDDDGRTFRQAQSVPVRTTLTAATFADERNGWAVGHGGVILHSADGGETWSLQRSDMREDHPLFTVHFTDARHGVAAGLWSLLLATADGGRNWNPVALPPPPEGGKADRNLFALFADAKGMLYIAAERGTVLRSADDGASWTYMNTGYQGSFWTGCALNDGTLLVAGLRGTVYRSTDGGRSWHAVASGTRSSITHIIGIGDRVVAVGLDGVRLESKDRGATFAVSQRKDSLSLTALSATEGKEIRTYSKRGVVAADITAPNSAAR